MRLTTALLLLAALGALRCGGGPTTTGPSSTPTSSEPVRAQDRDATRGTLYRVQVSYSGGTVFRPERSDAEPQRRDEIYELELHYRRRATAGASDDEKAAVLILQALRERQQQRPPGTSREMQVGNDRLRLQVDGKTQVDLRGREKLRRLTPRSLLEKTFAIMRTDLRGKPLEVTLRSRPEARSLLASVPLSAALLYTHVTSPSPGLAPGSVWKAQHTPLSPVARLGVTLDVEHRIVGYQNLGGVNCAHVLLRASIDGDQELPTRPGVTLDRFEARLQGEAWIDLATGEPYRVKLDDEFEIAFTSSRKDAPDEVESRMRYRYQGSASLDRLDREPNPDLWADGTKRFQGQ